MNLYETTKKLGFARNALSLIERVAGQLEEAGYKFTFTDFIQSDNIHSNFSVCVNLFTNSWDKGADIVRHLGFGITNINVGSNNTQIDCYINVNHWGT